MRQRTPQEKKKLSYERDRRTAYSESDKGSRKAIPRQSVRSFRRSSQQALASGWTATNDPVLEEAELQIRGRPPHPGWWLKFPDIPMRDFIARQDRAASMRECRRAARPKSG
jgi:hypothetical protein